MQKAFGVAEDFYRVRVIEIEENAPSELDWHEDILLREPTYRIQNRQMVQVEMISLDSGDIAVLGEFEAKAEAEAFLGLVAADLEELTKLQFEKKYRLD